MSLVTWYRGHGCWRWYIGWFRGGRATGPRGQRDVIQSDVIPHSSFLQTFKRHLVTLENPLNSSASITWSVCEFPVWCHWPSSLWSGWAPPGRSSSCHHNYHPSGTPQSNRVGRAGPGGDGRPLQTCGTCSHMTSCLHISSFTCIIVYVLCHAFSNCFIDYI